MREPVGWKIRSGGPGECSKLLHGADWTTNLQRSLALDGLCQCVRKAFVVLHSGPQQM